MQFQGVFRPFLQRSLAYLNQEEPFIPTPGFSDLPTALRVDGLWQPGYQRFWALQTNKDETAISACTQYIKKFSQLSKCFCLFFSFRGRFLFDKKKERKWTNSSLPFFLLYKLSSAYQRLFDVSLSSPTNGPTISFYSNVKSVDLKTFYKHRTILFITNASFLINLTAYVKIRHL